MATVLIADNDSAVSGLLTEVLVRRGLTVLHAFDGEAARDKARWPQVRVMVCDLDMPKIGGAEVLESLTDLTNPPAVIVISGYLDAPIMDRLDRLPYVREVLRKPFDLLTFAQRVAALVANSTGSPSLAFVAGE